MKNLRGVSIGIVTAVLVLGTLATVTLARPGFNLGDWDVVITYELDDDGDVVDYIESGIYDKFIDCSGTWTKTHESTQSSAQNTRLVEVAIDYVDGELASLDIEDGEKHKLIYKCDLFTLGLDDSGSASTIEKEQCVGVTGDVDDPVVDIWQNAYVDGTFSPNYEVVDQDGACYTLRFVRHESGGKVFTGSLNVGDVDGMGNLEVAGDQLITSVNDWFVVAGMVWNPPLFFTDGDNLCPDAQCTWETNGVAGLCGPGGSPCLARAVGDFGALSEIDCPDCPVITSG